MFSANVAFLFFFVKNLRKKIFHIKVKTDLYNVKHIY